MCCNKKCAIGYADGGLHMVKPSYGQRAMPGYAAAAYFTDPNALSALEFELTRQPMYVRKQNDYLVPKQKEMYGGPATSKDPLEKTRQEYLSRLEAVMKYADSVMAAAVSDYSRLSKQRQDYQALRAALEGKLSVVTIDPDDFAAPVKIHLTDDISPQSMTMHGHPQGNAGGRRIRQDGGYYAAELPIVVYAPMFARHGQAHVQEHDIQGLPSGEARERREKLEELIAREKELLVN